MVIVKDAWDTYETPGYEKVMFVSVRTKLKKLRIMQKLR